ncbi:MAG: hypothetical protein P8X88_02570 [Gammaproteobacteria bacterium]
MIFLGVLSACADQNISADGIKAEQNVINEPINRTRMHDLLQRIDAKLEGQLGSWVITYVCALLAENGHVKFLVEEVFH